MAAIDQILRNIIDTTYESLPADVLEPTKVQILDTLGVAVAGTSFGTTDPMLKLVKEWGGKKEATILSHGDRVPAPNAALVNGFLASVLDYDDTDNRGAQHISTTSVMPGFAIAERIGGINGKDFMTAVALSCDLTTRLARAVKKLVYTPDERGGIYFGTAYTGGARCFGATAVCGKLLNLEETKMRDAIGLALSQITPIAMGYIEGKAVKGIWGGLASRTGVTAALLAEKGLTGDSDPIEGLRGFYQIFGKEYVPEILTADLGKAYTGVTRTKLYPCCAFQHTSLDAILALIGEHNMKPEDVAEIIFEVGPRTITMFEQEGCKRYEPKNPIQCQFSLPWAAASAVIHGKVGIDDFTWRALEDKRVRDLMPKVTYKLNPEFTTAITVSMEPVIVQIKMKGGEVYSKRVDASLGSPENPASWDIIVEKFRDCCAHAIKPIPQANVDKVVRMVESLEDVANVAGIIRLLTTYGDEANV